MIFIRAGRKTSVLTISLLLACGTHHQTGAAGTAAPADSLVWTDPTSQRPEAQVFRTWMQYLDSKDGYFSRCWVSSPYWRTTEQQQWQCYDLAHSVVPTGTNPQVLRIEEAGSGEYRVVTRFRGGRSPDVTTTAYAIREREHWVFSNALLRTTRDWRRETIGPITYIFEPPFAFDVARARRAVAFTDSVAAAFNVQTLKPTTYYLTSDVDAAYRIVGAEFDTTFGTDGGFARPVNNQVFSGTPSLGEEYRHELVHLVLMPLHTANTTLWVSEGVATWLGGTASLDFSSAVGKLDEFLDTHPSATLDSILMSPSYTNNQRYPAAAVLVAMVFEQGGVPAVVEVYGRGPGIDEFKAALSNLLGQSWVGIRTSWREDVARFAVDPGR